MDEASKEQDSLHRPGARRPNSAAHDRYELQRFRHDINLVAFAASRGYAGDKRESSRNCCMMRHANGDKIAIGKAADGHWQYYSFRDERDNGDIIQFVQHRAGGRELYPLGAVRKELREWTHTEREAPCVVRDVQPVIKDREAVKTALAETRVVETHPYLEARGISRTTLAEPRFRGTWRQMIRYGNVVFPHRDLDGISGFEIKNRGFTGFATGGEKGLWCSRTRPEDTRLVIAESAIDALSYHQLHPHASARYVSFAGGLNPQQPELLDRAIARMPPNSTIIAATDRDHDGGVFSQRIADICAKHPHVTFVRDAPKLGCKDWNDHLRDVLARSPARSDVPVQTTSKLDKEQPVGKCRSGEFGANPCDDRRVAKRSRGPER